MSVQYNPLARQVQLGNWQTLLHWQDRSSNTALGAGSPLIQSIFNLPSFRHNPEQWAKGFGVNFEDSWAILLTDSLLSHNAFVTCPGMVEAGATLTLLSWHRRDGNATR